MDIKQLRALVAVSEHKSFSAAATALHTVQSNVSTHVARLEDELGAQLVDRATMNLTEEGALVVERAKRISNEMEALVSDVASLGDSISGRVSVGVIGTTARWLVPALLDRVSDTYPAIRLVILDATTTSLVMQLSAGAVDLAVVNTPVDEIDISLTPLFDEDRILVAPVGHPLYDRSSVTFRDLGEHELLLEAPGTAFRDAIDQQAAEVGVSFRAKAEVDGMRLVASLAFSGFGAAILPASAAPGFIGGDWKRVPIEGIDGRSVALARRRRGLPSTAQRAVAELISTIVTEVENLPTGIHPNVVVPTAK